MSILKINALKHSIGGALLFQIQSLDIAKGQFTAIVGPNGCGKTTFLKYLIGEYKVSKDRATNKTIDWEMGKKFAYVSQLNTEGTHWPIYVEDYLKLFLTDKNGKQRLDELLTRFDLKRLKRNILQCCSEGEQQRIMLAKALIHKPNVLILDEPTKGLDKKSIEFFFEHLHALKKNQLTILMVSHEIEKLIQYADYFISFKDNTALSISKERYVDSI